ncbi:dimethylmenaquinone methyltransferase [Rhodobacteraceae bacterium WD3A24]|nr:dimethylmenaquinone methyltransferase [Rhodobacteraceae bacterium WD3A24]
MKSDAEREAQLRARLAELDARLHGIEDELDSHQSKDWEDMAAERETDEALEGIGRSGLEEIRMIRAALDRIAQGEYGYCVKCGERISEERLDLLAHTPFCRRCAP